jgi:hypothetical protein
MPPSRFTWIFIITLFTGCPKKQSDADRPSASTMGAPANAEARVAAEAAPPGAVEIVLLDAGKGPRQPLVHELAPGAYDCTMRFSFASTMEASTLDGQSIVDDMGLPPLPTILLLYKARLEADDVPSRLRFSTTIFDVRMDAPSNPFDVELLRELKSAMIGQKSVVSMTTNGSVVDVVQDHGMPEGMPPSLSLVDHARDRHIWFPPEPVGIGARWKVITREVDTEGMAAETLTVYTLTERTEDWITVDVDTEMELFDDPTKAAIDDMTAMMDDTAKGFLDDMDADIQEMMSELGMNIEYSKQRSHGTLRTSLTSMVVEGHETFEMDTTIEITDPVGPTERIESHDVFKLEMTARKVGGQ